MGLRNVIAIVTVGVGLVFGGVASAEVPAGLAPAAAAGDIPAIGAIIVASQKNPAVLAEIAEALLATAESVKGTNPTLAALLAAEALSTGALSEKEQQRALNIIGSNPAALALLTNENSTNNNNSRSLGRGESRAEGRDNHCDDGRGRDAEKNKNCNGSRN